MTEQPDTAQAASPHRAQPDCVGPVSDVVAAFTAELPFALDPFQIESCQALQDGRGVLVAAPTGAGKTIVGEFAVYSALQRGAKAFYTTPIKALSNQKFSELCEKYGRDKVGLLTGDSSINGNAPVVVMTTEVLRNMLYAASDTLTDLAFVVMDEVHYLADRTRGAVWEEVIIGLPPAVQVVSLSATISNAEEFGAWLRDVRGDTDIIVSEHRPVPLVQHMLVGDKLLPLFDRPHATAGDESGRPSLNRALLEAIRSGGARGGDGGSYSSGGRGRSAGGHRGRPSHRRKGSRRGASRSGDLPHRRGGGGGRYRGRSADGAPAGVVGYPTMVGVLETEDLLPGICFVFSRAGCDRAVERCVAAGVRLTTAAESAQIRSMVLARCADLPAPDLRILEFEKWVAALQRGVAAHHAGMLPAFKSIVEELFEAGLVRMVFATETLALGVNMPARSVVIEKMIKYNGESHVEITAGEYTQLTGRAGRRGLDTVGHAVVMHRAGLDPKWVAGLASARTYPLRSSFRPSYNMAVNILSRLGRRAAQDVLESSFAQFQADRSSVDLAARVAEQQQAMTGYAEAMSCHLGDFADYAQLRRDVTEAEKASRRLVGIQKADALDDIAVQRKALKAHACHGCADRESHARWEQRLHDLQRDTDKLVRRIAGRTGSMSALFDQVCQVLVQCGYLTPSTVDGAAAEDLMVTGAGNMLRRVYSEADLLLAECLRLGIWDDLDVTTLAAMASSLVYSGRGDDVPTVPAMASAHIMRAWADTMGVLRELQAVERSHRVPLLPDPDPRAIPAMVHWAQGGSLEDVLATADMTAGDFVRLCRQVVDVVDQIRVATTDPELRATAGAVLDVVDRGVVAYSGGRGEDG